MANNFLNRLTSSMLSIGEEKTAKIDVIEKMLKQTLNHLEVPTGSTSSGGFKKVGNRSPLTSVGKIGKGRDPGATRSWRMRKPENDVTDRKVPGCAGKVDSLENGGQKDSRVRKLKNKQGWHPEWEHVSQPRNYKGV